MESNLTLGRMTSVEHLTRTAATTAAIVARGDSKLTETDRESLASGEWAEDVRRITHGRLFYIDLPKAIAARTAARKGRGGGLSKDARESLKTDAAMLLVQWADAREARQWQGETVYNGKLVCKLGGIGNLPYKRDWLDPENGEGVSNAAWDAMALALNAAERADSDYAARKREERKRTGWDYAAVSVEALLAVGMDGLTAAEKASLVNDIDTYGKAWAERDTLVLSASSGEVAKLLGLSQTAARYLESVYVHTTYVTDVGTGRRIGKRSNAACAHQWGVSIAAVKGIVTRGKAEIARKYPEPSELLDAIRAAARALPQVKEDAARETILDYRAAPSDSRRVDADLAAREFLSVARAMPIEKRSLYVALLQRLRGADAAERADLLSDCIPRLIAAEDLREWNNLRAGRRGILAGRCDSASDNALYIGKREWKSALEDSEILANRRAIAERASERLRRYLIACLCPHSLAACLLALKARDTALQSAHDRQVQLAIEQSLDSSYSYQFHPTPNAYGRAHMLADGRAMADVESRMEVARKQRLEEAREARTTRKRASQKQAATAARKRS